MYVVEDIYIIEADTIQYSNAHNVIFNFYHIFSLHYSYRTMGYKWKVLHHFFKMPFDASNTLGIDLLKKEKNKFTTEIKAE